MLYGGEKKMRIRDVVIHSGKSTVWTTDSTACLSPVQVKSIYINDRLSLMGTYSPSNACGLVTSCVKCLNVHIVRPGANQEVYHDPYRSMYIRERPSSWTSLHILRSQSVKKPQTNEEIKILETYMR